MDCDRHISNDHGRDLLKMTYHLSVRLESLNHLMSFFHFTHVGWGDEAGIPYLVWKLASHLSDLFEALVLSAGWAKLWLVSPWSWSRSLASFNCCTSGKHLIKMFVCFFYPHNAIWWNTFNKWLRLKRLWLWKQSIETWSVDAVGVQTKMVMMNMRQKRWRGCCHSLFEYSRHRLSV